jgi:hypothetical protein
MEKNNYPNMEDNSYPNVEDNSRLNMEDNGCSNTEDNGRPNMAGSSLANSHSFHIGTQYFGLYHVEYYNGPSRYGNATLHQPALPTAAIIASIASIASLVITLAVGIKILYKHSS